MGLIGKVEPLSTIPQQLDIHHLAALLCKGELDMVGHQDEIIDVQSHLNEAMRRLLASFPPVEPLLHWAPESGCIGKSEVRDWQITFQDCLQELCIAPTSGGCVVVSASNKPLKSFHILKHLPDRQAILVWLWEYAYNRRYSSKLPELDLHSMDALVRIANDHDPSFIREAKKCLTVDKNLARGVYLLLHLYDKFQPRLCEDDIPHSPVAIGTRGWHIRLQEPCFRHIRVDSTSVEGALCIYDAEKPMVSFRMFNYPLNWQAMLRWIWLSGDKQHSSQSLPQLDPRKMSALILGNQYVDTRSSLRKNNYEDVYHEDDNSGDNLMFYFCLRSATRAFSKQDVSEGVFKLLLAFQHFQPSLYLDESSDTDANGRFKKWHIEFFDSNFCHLRIFPSSLKGYVYIYSRNKFQTLFQVCDGQENLQAMLEWLWERGNDYNTARLSREVLNPRHMPRSRPPHRQSRSKKPLLHQVLRSADLKARMEKNSDITPVRVVKEEHTDDLVEDTKAKFSPERQPFDTVDPNRKGKLQGIPKDDIS